MIEIQDFNLTNRLLKSFKNMYDIEYGKLPYHINILDIIWANENAHSRILSELLKQNDENCYSLVDSFLKSLLKFDITFKSKNPKITSEKERIDLLVLDDDYALIIENKIHNARDGESQLARYLDKVIKKGYTENQIFIVYLTRDGIKKPEEQSWEYEGVNYKEKFAEYYFPLSYKDDILNWLIDITLPNCKLKDVYLKSTIEQYIDYLEGMLNIRKTHVAMNIKLQNHLKNELSLNSSPIENIEKLLQKKADIEKLDIQLNSLIFEMKTESLINWKKNLGDIYSNVFENIHSDYYRNIGVNLNYCNNIFSVLIEVDYKDNVYFGIGRHSASSKLNNVIESFVESLVVGFNKNDWWYGYKYITIENGYKELLEFIKKVDKLINNKA